MQKSLLILVGLMAACSVDGHLGQSQVSETQQAVDTSGVHHASQVATSTLAVPVEDGGANDDGWNFWDNWVDDDADESDLCVLPSEEEIEGEVDVLVSAAPIVDGGNEGDAPQCSCDLTVYPSDESPDCIDESDCTNADDLPFSKPHKIPKKTETEAEKLEWLRYYMCNVAHGLTQCTKPSDDCQRGFIARRKEYNPKIEKLYHDKDMAGFCAEVFKSIHGYYSDGKMYGNCGERSYFSACAIWNLGLKGGICLRNNHQYAMVQTSDGKYCIADGYNTSADCTGPAGVTCGCTLNEEKKKWECPNEISEDVLGCEWFEPKK